MKLKQQDGDNLEIQGSKHCSIYDISLNILDELRLIIMPVILGEGKLLFNNIINRQFLKLKETKYKQVFPGIAFNQLTIWHI